MPSNSKTFYQYLGLHSLLIGIFPFYIPVYLWKQEFSLGDISLFIALAGLGFCLGLWVWDRLRLKINLSALVGVSLVLEILFLCNTHILHIVAMEHLTLLVLGLTYGVYNSFFWTSQRALFFDLIDLESSGRKYGNFQIFVGVVLQAGILTGGFLLDRTSFIYLLAVSTLLALIGFFIIIHSNPRYPNMLSRHKSLKLKDILAFNDTDCSKLIFIIDGFFLFAESFFWLITLFLLAHESFSELGVMVLSLAAIFSILFYLLKNIIDRLGRKRVYALAVGLYALSWVLRAIAHDRLSLEVLYLFLVLITFSTTFFRLAMNKRFYDLAKLTCKHDYLMLKSYYSQISIFLIFGVFGLTTYQLQDSEMLLTPIYWVAAVFALSYFSYGAQRYNVQNNPERNPQKAQKNLL